MCRKAKKIVIKEIRLHAFNAIPWIFQDSKLKIIHLIRDPRGIYNSLLSRPDRAWFNENQTKEMCQKLSLDLMMLKNLDSNRYMPIKFEEMVQKPIEVFTDLNQRLNLQFDTQSLVNSYKNHQIKSQRYFSTYREKNYNPNHWQKNLANESLKRIEIDCFDYLALAQYI